MRRHLALLFLALAAATTLAACGDNGDGDLNLNPGGSATTDTDDMMDDTDMDDMDDMDTGDMGGMGHGEDRDNTPTVPGARAIAVTASSFSFEPAEIRAAAGEDIAIVLTSTDVPHDFVVDELDVHVAADAGETEQGGLRADEAGRYAFYCSVAGHREAGMEGVLVVE